MSTQTPNLNLDLREGTDIFNPLSTNANFETLDSVITEIRKKGGVPTYTTTASANLLKLSENPVPNETLFKFVAAGDANTWSYQETVNNIVALDGKQKTVKGGEMYVAWVNAANAMVVVAWPDVVDAQTFDGKSPAEWASKAQLDAANQTAANATQTAQAAATVANNALAAAQAAGMKMDLVFDIDQSTAVFGNMPAGTYNFNKSVNGYKILAFVFAANINQYSSNYVAFAVANPSGGWTTLYAVTWANSTDQTYNTLSVFAREVRTITDENFTIGDGKRIDTYPRTFYVDNAYMNILRVFGIK